MHTLTLVFLSLVITGDSIKLTWTPHPDNERITIVYDCAKDFSHPSFRAVNTWEITPTQMEGTFRRVPTPVGQKCWIAAQVLRGGEGWNGAEETLKSGEYQIMTWVEVA